MAMQPTPEEGGQSEPSVSGQSTGRKNEFTLTVGFLDGSIRWHAFNGWLVFHGQNQETRDEMKRIFDLTDTGEKGKEQAYQERRV